jgi:hypothetical protein
MACPQTRRPRRHHLRQKHNLHRERRQLLRRHQLLRHRQHPPQNRTHHRSAPRHPSNPLRDRQYRLNHTLQSHQYPLNQPCKQVLRPLRHWNQRNRRCQLQQKYTAPPRLLLNRRQAFQAAATLRSVRKGSLLAVRSASRLGLPSRTAVPCSNPHPLPTRVKRPLQSRAF